MTKKKRTICLFGIVAIIVVSLMSSTELMLRAAVFTHSPRSAITMEYKAADDKGEGKDLYIITKNAPVEEATQGVLTTWIVYHFGPLKFARYYGEG